MDLALTATEFSNSGSNNKSTEKNYYNKSIKNSSNKKASSAMSNSEVDNINLNEKDETKQLIAVRNLIKSANSKLNEMFCGNTIKRDYLTIVKVYCIFLKVNKII
jgi:hypothetical protein